MAPPPRRRGRLGRPPAPRCPLRSAAAASASLILSILLLLSPASIVLSFAPPVGRPVAPPNSSRRRSPLPTSRRLAALPASSREDGDAPSNLTNGAKGSHPPGQELDWEGGDGGAEGSPPPPRRFASDISPVRAFERTMRDVYKLRDYRFGDVTRKTVSKAKSDFEDAMRMATGNGSYRFGDLTKWELSKVSRNTDVHELVRMAGSFWRESLTPQQRLDVWIISLYLGSTIVLAYNSLSNFQSGATFAVAWTAMSHETGASPLAPGMWPAFLRRHATISLAANTALLCPVRLIIAVPWFFQYRHFIRWMEGKLPLRDKFPLVNRIMTVCVIWGIANVAAVAMLTLSFIWIGSLWTGVPILPVIT